MDSPSPSPPLTDFPVQECGLTALAQGTVHCHAAHGRWQSPLNCHSPMANLQRVTVRNWRPRRTLDPEGLLLLLPDAIFIESLYRADLFFWNREVRKTNLFKSESFAARVCSVVTSALQEREVVTVPWLCCCLMQLHFWSDCSKKKKKKNPVLFFKLSQLNLSGEDILDYFLQEAFIF